MLTSFPVNSKKELESLINLLKAAGEVYFQTNLRENLFLSSHEIIERLLNKVKRSHFLPGDFPLFGTTKENLSMSDLYRFYCM